MVGGGVVWGYFWGAGFPGQLGRFLAQEVGEAGPDSEEPETFDEIDEQARLCEDGDDDA